jgi:Protein of unknown function (DUF3987)
MPKSFRRSPAQRIGDLVPPDDVPGTSRAAAYASMSASSSQWPEIDPSLLEERRGMLPPFPINLMPLPWRAWLSDTAAAANAPIDYAAQALFAAVSGLCGAGAAVRVTPTWQEPLVLWQLAVGRVSSGRSPARASTRRMLATVEEEMQAIVVDDAQVHRIDEVAAANARGCLLWRDEAGDWFACLKAEDDRRRRLWLQSWSAGSGAPAAVAESAAVSILGAVQPEQLGRLFRDAEDLAARYLYAWPHQPPFRSVVGSPSPDDGEALSRLRRIARKAGTVRDPLMLLVDERGLGALDTFMAGVHAALREAEGLEEAWLGKGRGTVVRLAGILELLDWSATGSMSPPGHIGRERIEEAAALWEGYFRPHATSLFVRAAPTTTDVQVRRVARWLRSKGMTCVTREQVRRDGLSRTVNASDTDQVLYRLRSANIVRQMPDGWRATGGRPTNIWEVNPALAHTEGLPERAERAGTSPPPSDPGK